MRNPPKQLVPPGHALPAHAEPGRRERAAHVKRKVERRDADDDGVKQPTAQIVAKAVDDVLGKHSAKEPVEYCHHKVC